MGEEEKGNLVGDGNGPRFGESPVRLAWSDGCHGDERYIVEKWLGTYPSYDWQSETWTNSQLIVRT